MFPLVDKDDTLQKDLEQLQHTNKQLLESQKAAKRELETLKDQLTQKLQDIENKRKENKEELQLVEETSDGEELLEEKDRLLKSQWKLDEEKNIYKRHILGTEKALEPLEMQMTRTEN